MNDHAEDAGNRLYDLTNHLGNVMVTVSDILLNPSAGVYLPYIVSAQDYYSFGSTMPGRQYGTPSRYGFNGKELDQDLGQDDYDYGMRISDSRLGRFLSVDPLTRKFASLTPYQFASNSPIQAVDLDGQEGVQYLETQTNNGVSTVKRVVEVDVYVAISRVKNSVHFYSKNPASDEKVKKEVIGDLKSEFKDDAFKDDEGNNVIWRFNVKTFEVDDKQSINSKHNELSNDNSFRVIGEDSKTQYRGVIVQRQHISDQKVPAEPTDLPVTEDGNFQRGFNIAVNDEYYSDRDQKSHTLGHEVTHYLLRLHPNKAIRDPDNTPQGHSGAGGGILNYGTANFRYPGMIRSTPDEKTTVTFDGLKPLNQTNVTNILRSVPQKPATTSTTNGSSPQ